MRVEIPTSKSCYARIAMISAIAGIAIPYSDENDDIIAIRIALTVKNGRVWVGSSGTAARFAIAYYSSMDCEVVIDGSKQLQKRPMSSIIDAVRRLGAEVQGESLPLRIKGCFWTKGEVEVDASQSSQTISALMLAGMRSGLNIKTIGERNSWSYVELTADVMRKFGVDVEINDGEVSVGGINNLSRTPVVVEGVPVVVEGVPMVVEKDWSSAAFWYGWCTANGGEIEITGLSKESCQPDSAAIDIFGRLGVVSEETTDGIKLTFKGVESEGVFDVDCRRTPDLAMVLIPTLCRIGRRFAVSGLDTLDRKESRRGEALCRELSKYGYVVEWDGNKMVWNGEVCNAYGNPEVYGDHRMVMAHLILGNRPDLTPLSKSYPALKYFFAKKFGGLEKC